MGLWQKLFKKREVLFDENDPRDQAGFADYLDIVSLKGAFTRDDGVRVYPVHLEWSLYAESERSNVLQALENFIPRVRELEGNRRVIFLFSETPPEVRHLLSRLEK